MTEWVTRCLVCYERASGELVEDRQVTLRPCGHTYPGLKVTTSVEVADGYVAALRIDAAKEPE